MADDTAIEWADDTLNFWWGCFKVSPACTNCYAETWDARWGGEHWGRTAPRKLRVDRAIADLRRIERRAEREGKPRRVFIASMSDFFEDRADLVEPRLRAWEALHKAGPGVIPMLLTKRPDVMAAWALKHGWPERAWAGTTVEGQAWADKRLQHLLQIEAAPVRFVSCEPLLAGVDLERVRLAEVDDPGRVGYLHALAGWWRWNDDEPGVMGQGARLNWVIAGGESGPNARPSRGKHFRALRDQCARAGVPFFFKQWGAWAPCPSPLVQKPTYPWKDLGVDGHMARLGKKAAGRELDGREHNDIPLNLGGSYV